MVSKEQFKTVVDLYKKHSDSLDQLKGFINIDHPIIDAFWELFDEYLKVAFTEEGADVAAWWIIECQHRLDEDLMWDKDGNVIPLKTVDDLWDYIKDFRK